MRKLLAVSIATLTLFGGIATATSATADELPGGTFVVFEDVSSAPSTTSPAVTTDPAIATDNAVVALTGIAGDLVSFPMLN
jgi:hypothetical protein